MPTYRTPDVYVEEISLFPPSVAEVETAIPAFIGYTKNAKKIIADDLRDIPTRIKSMVEYEAYYGCANNESFSIALIEDTDNGTFEASSTRVTSNTSYKMYYSLKMYFDNGGGPCYIVSVGNYADTITAASLIDGLAEIKKEDEPTILVFPDAVELTESADYYSVMNAALTQCEELKDRVAVIDLHGQDITVFRNTINGDLSLAKYGAAYHPFLKTTLNFEYNESNVTILSHLDQNGAAPAVDLTKGILNSDDPNAIIIKNENNKLYNTIIAAITKVRVELPPSSLIAGVYAKVDNTRGVWKAPANVTLKNVIEPTIKITNEDQGNLNIDPVAGKSINAIRAFVGKGTKVWGARTLAGNDNEWRYISVRRFFNMVEESVKKSTYWAVFEPNDANTWIKVKSMIENYLTKKWRDGALAGATTDEAFYVNVGLGITMTPLDILEGLMNVEIGMAVVRPAEFIVLKFSHKLQES